TALGFDSVSVTRISGDGGIDVRGTLVVGDVIKTKLAVQVKRWKNNIQAPVIRVWEYDIHSIIRDRLFILLPFKIFRFRKILTGLFRAGSLTPEKKRSISDELMAEMQILVHEINTLAEQGMIDDNANFILISATTELINYLNRNFLPECRNEQKVEQMFVGVTEKAMQKGIQQGIQQGTLQKSIEIAKKLLKKGIPIEEISELTGVDVETIKELIQ
ncbi:MAG: restriction endonuclease, partial [Methanobacteriota archaeon]